ncbi:hypothetical protein AMTRI_Chr01g105210 [Amborella trichopoda]
MLGSVTTRLNIKARSLKYVMASPQKIIIPFLPCGIKYYNVSPLPFSKSSAVKTTMNPYHLPLYPPTTLILPHSIFRSIRSRPHVLKKSQKQKTQKTTLSMLRTMRRKWVEIGRQRLKERGINITICQLKNHSPLFTSIQFLVHSNHAPQPRVLRLN